jgi:hypothetical protein
LTVEDEGAEALRQVVVAAAGSEGEAADVELGLEGLDRADELVLVENEGDMVEAGRDVTDPAFDPGDGRGVVGSGDVKVETVDEEGGMGAGGQGGRGGGRLRSHREPASVLGRLWVRAGVD